MRFAFALVLFLVPPLAVAQTDTTAVAPTGPAVAAVSAASALEPTAARKEVALGYVLGYLFPGAGHYYAGETSTGAILTATGLAGSVLLLTSAFTLEIDCSYSSCNPNPGPAAAAIAGAVLVIGSAGYSVIDGGRAVRRTNRRNGYTAASPRTTVVPHGAGLAMRVRL